MATIRIPGGPAGERLAETIVEASPSAEWQRIGDGIEIHGRRLDISVAMIEKALWPGADPDTRSAIRYLRLLVRVTAGTVMVRTENRLVVAEEAEQETALLVRFPASIKTRLAGAAERLGMSQNEFVVRAVEDLLNFLEEFGGSASIDT